MLDREDGPDHGDLSREFTFLLSREMFSPFYCFFECSAHDSRTLQIDPGSNIMHQRINPERLNYLKLIGRCLGMAILHRRLLDTSFIVPFYKMIPRRKVVFADLESVDVGLHRGLTWVLGNDITGIIDETFTTTEERFGEIFTVELRPGEADIPVTEEKKNYVNAIVEYRLSKCANDQFEALMIGLCEPVPWDVLQTFDEQELELLISSISEIATTGANSQTTEDLRQRMKSPSGSGSASEAGRRNANPP